MSQENSVPISSVFNMVSSIQRVLLYVIFFLIPWFVIPLPYDSTEKAKSILFIVLSSLLILLEVIKWVWDGKVSIVKSTFDKVFLLLFGSFFVSFVFARDSWISLWGYDGRMGRGFLVMIFLFIFFYLARGILQKKKEVVRGLEALSLGILVLLLISLLSVLKVDIFGWLQYINNFFVVGLPLTFSFQEIMLIAGSSVLINLFLVVHYVLEEKYQATVYPILALIVSFVSLPLFSVNQGALIPILFFIVSVLLCIVLAVKLKKSLKALPIFILVLSGLATAFSLGFQYESFRTSVLGESFEILNPVRLGSDISWIVASSSIVGDFLRGLVGLGNDSFAIAYNAYRPATDATLALGNSTFITGSNEVFTVLANRGLIGVAIWLFLGFVILKVLIKDVTTGKGEKSLLSLVLGLNIAFLFLGSIFLPFSFLTYFLLFVAVLLFVALNNKEENTEEFLLKFWAVNVGAESKDINKTMESINWFFTILVTLATTAIIILFMVKMVSVAFIVRAEAYNIEKNNEYLNYEGEIAYEIREEYLGRMAGYYDQAMKYDPSNPYITRRGSLISLELVNLLSERFESASEEEKKAISSEITIWKNTSIDLSRQAIATSPLTYANWNTRASVYLGLVSVGFTDYNEDALLALQNCVNLNPLDFDSYYRAGQIFMIREEYDQALASFNRVLNINGQHVPSLVLSANILVEKGDKETAITYLQAAKSIMELNKQDSGEVYDSIVKGLVDLGVDPEAEEVEEVETETTTETGEED